MPQLNSALQARLKRCQEALVAKGVTSIGGFTVVPEPGTEKPTLDKLGESMCRVLEACLDGRYEPMPPIGDKALALSAVA